MGGVPKISAAEIEEMKKLIASPIYFIGKFWGLVPQPLICENNHTHSVKCYGEFIKGTHITWQQTQILQAVEQGKKRIAVKSGNGVGKDCVLSWLIHWYLFTHYKANIGCTAPSADTLYDVLWKEIMVWRQKLSKPMQAKFEWTTDRYKFSEAPEVWWARARTARKEASEAFMGLHGDNVFLVGDEAAGIAEEVYSAGEGALTGENTLVILVGNPTRLEGYFYDCFHKHSKGWTLFTFSGEESPIVNQDFLQEVIARYGKDSDEYRWKVLGEFPKSEGIDSKGWMPLLQESDLKYCPDTGSFKSPAMGIDPSGEGKNETAIVVRDAFMAKVVMREEISKPKGIADKALTLGLHYVVPVGKIVIDNFGQGANVGMEISLSEGKRPRAVNVGDKPDNKERFVNLRAELYWRLREWILKGGQLVNNPKWKQLLTIRYKRTGTGRIQIMSKLEAKRDYGFDSPDVADALSLSFLSDNESVSGVTRSDLTESELDSILSVY